MLKEKRWKKEFEEEIFEVWEKDWPFKINLNSNKKIFSIDTPPPYVNAPIHIGHAASYTLMDFIARFKRVKGYEVLFPLGLDRNGLPIEVATEKEFRVDPKKIGREEFIKLCKKLLDKYSDASSHYFKRLGISFNSYKVGEEIGDAYLTDSESYRSLTQATFIKLWNQGLIYKDKKVSNFCPRCKAAIADAEIEYKEKDTFLNYIKFKVKESEEEIIIATTRPELLCTCRIILFNPEDERYKHLEGMHAIIPIYEREVPIKKHPYAKQEFGSGLVMMCSFGDYTDIRFFREENLDYIIAINEDGKMNENAGFLKGLEIEKARERILEELEKKGLLVKKEKIKHKVPVCGRCKSPLEFVELEEWYLKQVEFKEDMLKIANEIKIFSEESRKRLIDWINSISIDWCISRRRYYATEIPLWYCEKCGYIYVPEEQKLKYYVPWKDNPPIKKCPKCGNEKFRGEEEVFDTWFDSSISPLYILGYIRFPKFFEKAYPCSLRPQGKDIIRTWLYYTLLRCYQLTNKPCFENVYINHHVVDEKGKKMSKSLGNVISPKEILEEFGAEPFRLWVALAGDFSKGDFKCSKERIANEAKTLTKLWNIARFISLFEFDGEKVGEVNLEELDKSVLEKLNEVIEFANREFENYNFFDATEKIINFMWDIFASNYLELVKPRVYSQENAFSEKERKSALFTLNYVLDTLLKLLYPIIPFITSKLYLELRGKEIWKEEFPKIEIKVKSQVKIEEVIEINTQIWKEKKDKNLSLKEEVKKIYLPEKFRIIEKDLKFAHNLKEIEYWKENKAKLEF